MCWLCVQALKGKILVKGKRERVVEECSSCSSDLSSSDDEASHNECKPSTKNEDKKVGTVPAAHLYPSSIVPHRIWWNWLGFLGNSTEDKLTVTGCLPRVWWFLCVLSQPGVSKLSPELSELVVYTCSVHFKSFEQAAKNPATDMSSFSESEALRHIKDSGMMCACD